MCADCPKAFRKVNEDVMRDRIVVGIFDDEVRHKILVQPSLTLETAFKLCRAEEAAKQTEHGIAPSLVKAARKSTYRQQKSGSLQKKSEPSLKKSDATASSTPKTQSKCPNCGRSAHTKSPCPAADKKCNNCHRTGHFQAMCRQRTRSDQPSSRVGQLKLNRTSALPSPTVQINTMLATENQPTPIAWVPDTGSDIDAIGICQLETLGGFVET